MLQTNLQGVDNSNRYGRPFPTIDPRLTETHSEITTLDSLVTGVSRPTAVCFRC